VQIKNSFGMPYFQWRNGFIFNEGGKHITLTITKYLPFRLWVGFRNIRFTIILQEEC